MLLDLKYNYLKPEVLQSLQKYVEDVGKDLFLADIESLRLPADEAPTDTEESPAPNIYGNKHLEAFNLTFTTNKGWNNLSKLYPGFDDYLESIVDFNCNMIHIVALKGHLGSAIPLHQDDSLSEHLDNCIEEKYRRIYLGPDSICSDHTTLIYLKIPQDMEGGELYIEENGDTRYYKPYTNLMLKITGDTMHGVTAVTKTSSPRYVLVCEQYKLSLRNLRRLAQYDNPMVIKG